MKVSLAPKRWSSRRQRVQCHVTQKNPSFLGSLDSRYHVPIQSRVGGSKMLLIQFQPILTVRFSIPLDGSRHPLIETKTGLVPFGNSPPRTHQTHNDQNTPSPTATSSEHDTCITNHIE